GRETIPRQIKLPSTHVTSLFPTGDGLWVGTMRGAFFKGKDGQTDYYASKRWLNDDQVTDIRQDPGGDILILTATGLNRIQSKLMTLAEKAAYYERKIQQRHIRHGFCAELRLTVPGDISSAEMVDTDNDGTWSNYYMASQAFRFGATRKEEARRNAWETFEALERLESITGLEGFPARTFERTGFKSSDPDRWHRSADGQWEWKGTTSSDEVTAHTFGCSVLWETTARTAEEKGRITRFYDRIISHVLRNNLYLVDVDGKPTLWGRWNPEYVNWYPPSIVDRRLNSAEIIAMLQFAYRITGKELYREKAVDLLYNFGYLDNILIGMRNIKLTPGFIYQGNDMGIRWNHSDDLLAFVTYWVLHRYALTDELRAQYSATIRDHWEIEKIERCPLWNFVCSITQPKDFDVTGALWTLRKFPLDLSDWAVANSHRQDLTRLPDNFRHQQSAELLPPNERPIMRWNGNPFVLDGGSGGHVELAGDEFLLPYWMARYLRIIE
ncbi:MAG TPA: two-component regulator propeller domain-containing protein, partial [Verrucomicrobiae bacterium]|nr:two-component regulator propeller domain-containing protein [Verrucomicrobiae bacterium]